MLKKLLLFNLLLFSGLLTLNAQTAATAKEAIKPDTAEIRRQSFEKVWTIVNEKHYDPTFGGVDWRKVREIYEPKALAAKSDGEFHAILNQMLGELKLSHFNVIPRRSSDGVVAASGAGKLGDKDVYVIVGTPDNLPPETFYFDAKSGLLLRQDITVISPEGRLPSKTFYEDIREVDGVKIPFKIRSVLPQFEIIAIITEVKNNVAVEDAIFAKPKA